MNSIDGDCEPALHTRYYRSVRLECCPPDKELICAKKMFRFGPSIRWNEAGGRLPHAQLRESNSYRLNSRLTSARTRGSDTKKVRTSGSCQTSREYGLQFRGRDVRSRQRRALKECH